MKIKPSTAVCDLLSCRLCAHKYQRSSEKRAIRTGEEGSIMNIECKYHKHLYCISNGAHKYLCKCQVSIPF